MKKNYVITASIARAILEQVPESEYIAGAQGCSLFHINRHYNPSGPVFKYHEMEDNPLAYPEAKDLYDKVNDYASTKGHVARNYLISVNDRPTHEYKEYSAKDRVQMLLSDMIAAGY